MPTPKSLYNMRYVNRARDTLEDMLHFDEQLSESPIIGQQQGNNTCISD